MCHIDIKGGENNMKKQSLCEADHDLLLKYGLPSADHGDVVRLLYEPGEYVLLEGGPIDYLYFVVSGKAKVLQVVSNGRQLVLCYFVSNGVMGDVELMAGRHEAFSTVQAVSRLTCIGIPLSRYASTLKSNIVFINNMGKELSDKVMRSGFNGTIKILLPLEAKLCAYILQTADGGVFREKKTELAELLGTSYRHLLRCLDKLCTDGVLQKKPSGYQIANLQALNNRAGDLYVL
jgi:CRP/FNR family putative post-exponential-phase nitrogen-starvation transcriptional regulator